MKTSISFLPKYKQDELRLIKSFILNIVPDVEMIILFGSYARDCWVEDKYVENGIVYEYVSDYDILILVQNQHKAKNRKSNSDIKRIMRNRGHCKTPISLIIESIKDVNKEITEGSYFFNDIKKEGILLYNSKNVKLAKRRKLNMVERKEKAQKNFDNWFDSANEFFDMFEYAFGKQSYKLAAFQLHQATERLYHTTLLVFTDYKPKLHDLDRLGVLASRLDIKFKKIFPRETDEERRLFNLLKRAYIDARYNMDFDISKIELEYLAKKVTTLKKLTDKICKKQIEKFVD